MRVADVVAVREQHVDDIRGGNQRRPAPVRSHESGQSDGGEQRSGPPELLEQVEAVHRRVVARHSRRHVQDHGFPPVGLGDVEPCRPQCLQESIRRIGTKPERPQIPRVLQRAGGCRRQRERDHRPREERAPSARRRRQQEERIRRREQNHREVVAERERVHDEERAEPRQRRPLLPPQQQAEREPDEEHVQRVHLRDDGLAPEGVRPGEEQRAAEAGEDGPRHFRGDERQRPQAIAASTADARFRLWAASPPATRRNAAETAKYNG